MSTAQPFPKLASAESSPSASPGPESIRPPARAGATGKSHDRRKKPLPKRAGGGDGATAAEAPLPRAPATDSAKSGGSRRKPRKPKAPAVAAAAADPPAPSSAPPEPRRAAEKNPRRRTSPPKVQTPDEPKATRDGAARRKSGRRRGTKKQPARSESTSSSRPSSALMSRGSPVSSASPLPQGRTSNNSSSSSTLARATIVACENGRARVLLGPRSESYLDEHEPMVPGMEPMEPRFSSAHVIQQRRSSAGVFGASSARVSPPTTAHYGDKLGLGAGTPMHTPVSAVHAGARSATAPGVPTLPSFRQRSLTSTQLRATAQPFSPQNHSGHYQAPQLRRLSSATDVPAPPMSAPVSGEWGARNRSHSMSTHVSMTGLRISMSQSRPGNVLSPHLPVMAQCASGYQPSGGYTSSGYFGTRRASVSNVGLAVDPSNSIRIPTIMFQRPKAEDPLQQQQQDGGAAKGAGMASLITPVTAEADAGHGHPDKPASASSGVGDADGDSPAMRRLQEMIASMRSMNTGKSARDAVSRTRTSSVASSSGRASPMSAGPVPSGAVAMSLPAVSSAPAPAISLPPITMPPTPAAHPTSRFDSILEEDEDNEEDEVNLDAEIADDSSATANDPRDGAAAAPSAAAAAAEHSLGVRPKSSALYAL